MSLCLYPLCFSARLGPSLPCFSVSLLCLLPPRRPLVPDQEQMAVRNWPEAHVITETPPSVAAFRRPPGECKRCRKQVTVTVIQGLAWLRPSLPWLTLRQASSPPCLRNSCSRGQKPGLGEQGREESPASSRLCQVRGQHQEQGRLWPVQRPHCKTWLWQLRWPRLETPIQKPTSDDGEKPRWWKYPKAPA